MVSNTEILGITYVGKEFIVLIGGVTNKGSSTVSNVIVQGTIPDGVELTKANMPQGDYDPDLHRWEVGNLVPGQILHGELHFKITDANYSSYEFKFEISSSDQCDDCIEDNFYCVTFIAYPCSDALNCIDGPYDDNDDATANGVGDGEFYYLSETNLFGLPPGIVIKKLS